MQKRALRNGVALTELGLGVAQFGNLHRPTTEDEAEGAIDAAWEAGIRTFDTAPHYGLGLSERRLGRLLAQRPRDEFVLSTKVGRLLVPNPGATGRDTEGFDVPATTRREWDLSRDGILRSLDESLTRLGLDRVDILYIHDPDLPADGWERASKEAVPALVELREQGVIGAFGVGMNESAMPARFVRECDIDLVMLAGRYTLLEQGALDDLLPLAEERGVGIVIAGVYNSGLLAVDRPGKDAKYNYETAPRELIDRAGRLADVCESHGVTLPEAAIAYPLHHPAVVSVVVGARNREQVDGNVARFSKTIPASLWTDLVAEELIRPFTPSHPGDPQ
jgi:D-threo-aldose 1-dehydrogenase